MGWSLKDIWKKIQPPKKIQRELRNEFQDISNEFWRDSRRRLWGLADLVNKVKETLPRNSTQKIIRERFEAILPPELTKEMDDRTIKLLVNALMSLAKDLK